MKLLVFNTGSSSLSYKVWQSSEQELQAVAWGKAHRLAANTRQASFVEHQDGDHVIREAVAPATHATAARLILDHLRGRAAPIALVGHRIVNGGHIFRNTTPVNDETMTRMQAILLLAPVHNGPAVEVITLARTALPQARQYLTFDTAFHASLPPEAHTYALPAYLRSAEGFRKFGFHGLSYQSVSGQIQSRLGDAMQRLIVCHLGAGGSSVAAIRQGRSVDTSMGFTPLAGLVMGTRSGDLDPAVVLMLAEQGYSTPQINQILNKESGLLGLSGFSSDLREVVARYEQTGDEACGLAIAAYAHRLRHYIGAYMAVLGGVDVLAFTDDVGLEVWQMRERACEGMEWAGLRLDRAANRAADPKTISAVHENGSPVQILVVPNDEERVIAEEGIRLHGHR